MHGANEPCRNPSVVQKPMGWLPEAGSPASQGLSWLSLELCPSAWHQEEKIDLTLKNTGWPTNKHRPPGFPKQET